MRRRAIIGALLLVGVAMAGGVAYATIPDANSVIHGCRNNATGLLRVIDPDTDSCRTSESPLDWNQAGLTAGNVTVRNASGPLSSTESTIRRDCLDGEIATGGGVSGVSYDGGIAVVTDNIPEFGGPNSTPTGWAGRVLNIGPGEVQAVAWVICVRP